MAASSSSSSSSDSESDSEETRRLKEAAIEIKPKGTASNESQNKTVIIKNKAKPTGKSVPQKPSLRTQVVPQDDNELHVTPEFQTHIAKKLTSFLDRSVEVIATNSEQLPDISRVESDVDTEFKLFSTSLPGYEKPVAKAPRRRLPSSSSDSSAEDERCRSIAVSGDLILAQSKLEENNRHKNVCEDEPVKTKHTSHDELVKEKSSEPSKTELNAKIKKHKKKKKKKISETS